MKRLPFLTLAIVLLGCSKKEDSSNTLAASASAAASVAASAAPSAQDSTQPSGVSEPSWAARSGAATTPTDPNTPPSHAEHEQAAAVEIHKGNYKNELEKLEKEDLSGDRK